jgi:glycyl-tRNA synthetase beta subunit
MLGIEALAAQLGSITFVAGEGSFADKTARLQKLVEALGGGEASLEAAQDKARREGKLVMLFVLAGDLDKEGC